METPRLLLASLLVLAPLAAQTQEPTPAEKTQQPAGPPTAQESPMARLLQLQAEKERLEQEIAYVRGRTQEGAMARMVREKMKQRTLELRSIDAGASKAVVAPPPPVAPVQIQKARVMTADQLQSLPKDVLMTVNGRPVTKAMFDEAEGYLKSYPASGNDELRTSRVAMEMIRTEAAHAAFGDGAKAAEEQIAKVADELAKGKDFAELARQHSKGPNPDKGGDLGWVTRNSYHGLMVEYHAFRTEPGKVSPVFRTPMGFNLLRVEKFEKGEQVPVPVQDEDRPEGDRTADTDPRNQDRVQAQLILIPYVEDLNKVRGVQSQVATGSVEILVRDQEAMKLLPPMYRAD